MAIRGHKSCGYVKYYLDVPCCAERRTPLARYFNTLESTPNELEILDTENFVRTTIDNWEPSSMVIDSFIIDISMVETTAYLTFMALE
jgi:hypothetical protein